MAAVPSGSVLDQNGPSDHFGQNDLIPNRILNLASARPKWTKKKGPFWPEEVHFGPFRSTNGTLAIPDLHTTFHDFARLCATFHEFLTPHFRSPHGFRRLPDYSSNLCPPETFAIYAFLGGVLGLLKKRITTGRRPKTPPKKAYIANV